MVGTPDPPLVPVSLHKAAPSSVFTAEEADQGTQGGGGGGGGIVRGGADYPSSSPGEISRQ